MITTIRRSVAGVIAAAALVLGAAGTASAEADGFHDGEDTPASQADITFVSVKHNKHNVSVRTQFTDLAPDTEGGPSSLTVYLDTNPAKRGPEFRLATGLQEGSDFQLVRMRDWAPVGEPLSCRHSLEIDFETNKVDAVVNRKCIGSPGEVRVGAKSIDAFDGDSVLVDWMKKPRAFTEWLAAA